MTDETTTPPEAQETAPVPTPAKTKRSHKAKTTSKSAKSRTTSTRKTSSGKGKPNTYGRPLSSKDDSRTLTVSMPFTQIQSLRRISAETGVPISRLMRPYIEKLILARSAGTRAKTVE